MLLRLFRDFTQEYNANSLSKEVNTTSRGTLKILKKLQGQNLVTGRHLGKAVFYKVNLEDEYVRKIIETLLIAEARRDAQRWLHEFKDIFNSTEIVIIFGSAIKNIKNAVDIDVLLIFKKQNYKKIKEFVQKKNKIFNKPIHEIPQTIKDLTENLRKKNPAIVDAIKTGYVLHGAEKIVVVMKNVAGR